MTAFAIPLTLATALTTSGTLVAGKHNPVATTAGTALTGTLPAPSANAHLVVERTDATTGTVTVSGNIRGVSNATISLVWQAETVELISDGSTWYVTASHKRKSDLDLAYARADVVAPAPTGVAATDTANLQAAINATPAGGSLFIPARTALGIFYVINAALTIPQSISITGQHLVETWKGTVASGSLNHPVTPFLAGSVIKQTAAATDAIQITGSGITPNIENLGILFDTTIAGNTGHGINAATTVVPGGGGHDSGPLGFTWRNVSVKGHDGNHYGFLLLNPMYFTMQHLHSFDGGGFSFQCDSFVGNYGNGVITDAYAEVTLAGTADGFNLQSRTGSNGAPAATGTLNLLTFVRPQSNVTNAASAAGTQNAWRSNGGAGMPIGVKLITPDLEINPTSSTSAIDFGGVDSGTTVIRGGLLSKPPVNGYSTDQGHRIFTSTTTWVVPRDVYEFRVRATGAGGGGGGGGSNAAAAANVGGAGGGAGLVVESTVACTPGQSFTFTIGAAGTSGAGGASGGNPGIVGGNGGNTSVSNTSIAATGGGGGAPGLASSTTAANGGWYGRTGNLSLSNVPGFGGNSQSPNGLSATQLPPGVCGGGGGGAATTTLGGGGGGATTTSAAYFHNSGGNGGASSTVAGVNGVTATLAGCGGGGGGGALTGGAGGNGGAGAPGQIEIWY